MVVSFMVRRTLPPLMPHMADMVDMGMLIRFTGLGHVSTAEAGGAMAGDDRVAIETAR